MAKKERANISKGLKLPLRRGSQSAVNRSRYNSLRNSESDTEASIELSNRPRTKRKSKGKTKPEAEEGNIPLEKKPSPVIAPLPKLTKEEEKLFLMVERGDVEGVKNILSSTDFRNHMSINRTNRMGYTLLHLAVLGRDENMVKLLLQQKGIRIHDTILHAIEQKSVEITNLLLEFHDKLQDSPSTTQYSSLMTPISSSVMIEAPSFHPILTPMSPRSGLRSSVSRDPKTRKPSRTDSGFESPPMSQMSESKLPSYISLEDEDEEDGLFDSEFNPVITPLMLAAQVGSTKLMEIFYKRGERLETQEFTHNLKCQCDICEILLGGQDMTRVHQRYHLFKSITSPKYICFIARKEKIDPINYAIDKIIKLRVICQRVTVDEKQYEEFLNNLEGFIVRMIDLCRTTEETEIFLSPKDTLGKESLPHHYPRLWYTVGLTLRKFVAHHNTQNIVYKMWATDEYPKWHSYPYLYRLCTLLIRIPPGNLLISAIIWAVPHSPIGRILKSPVSRFLNYIMSYITFLGVISIQVLWPYQRCNDQPPYFEIDDDHCKNRGPPQIGTEWILVCYVASFYLSLIRKQSISWYWNMKWNWVELIMLFSFTGTFICWLMSWLWVREPKNANKISATDRLMWPHNSPEIVGECFLALSTTLACARLLQFIQVFPKIGPIQIGLGRQILDFLNTALIYIVVLFAFASGLLGLYVPYKNFEGIDKNNRPAVQDNTFTELSPALQSLFWYLYGHIGEDPATLLSWEVEDPQTNGTDKTTLIHHKYTEWTGLTLYFIYHVIGSMMMFTMLSGYFSQTLSIIMEDINTHWQFNRTELYLTFIKETWLPPPFSLIPPLPNIIKFLSGRYCVLMGRKEDPKLVCTWRECCYITEGRKRTRWTRLLKQYRKLIVELMFRYNEYTDVLDKDDIVDPEDSKEKEEERNAVLEFLGKKESKTTQTQSKGGFSDGKPPPPPPPPRSGSGMGGAGAQSSTSNNTRGVTSSIKSLKQSERGGSGVVKGGRGGSSAANLGTKSQSTTGPSPSPSKNKSQSKSKMKQNQESTTEEGFVSQQLVQHFPVQQPAPLNFPPDWLEDLRPDNNANRLANLNNNTGNPYYSWAFPLLMPSTPFEVIHSAASPVSSQFRRAAFPSPLERRDRDGNQ